MSAKYLLRFDDICPTMNWEVWAEVQNILLEFKIAPLLAVIPDNRDPSLVVSDYNPQFWERVREWQRLGWTIGLHGYQHTFATTNSGIIGINNYSEFSGLSEAAQESKLRRALEILAREGVNPDVWVAPAHSFDYITVKLLHTLGLRNISDGFFLSPRRDKLGMLWIPQQLWRFRRMPPGIWTVCFHINTWDGDRLSKFRAGVERFSRDITDLKSVIVAHEATKFSAVNGLVSALIHGSMQRLIKCKRRLRPAD